MITKGLMQYGFTALLLSATGVAGASDPVYPPARVSYDDFKDLVAEVEAHRAERLVDLDTFLEMSKEPDTLILDTRSGFRFDRIHVKGAKHLSFTDFTQANLQRIIPSPETRILIYCNNNFEGNPADFATKAVVPSAGTSSPFAEEIRPVTLALNIPTYINLYGYGYRNVYELDELVDVRDPRIAFAGTDAVRSGR